MSDDRLEIHPYGPADFEKIATEIELSQDVQSWPTLILQEFASEHPYAFENVAPEIEFEQVDEDTGNAFGAIILKKPYQVTGLGGPQERLEQEPEKVAVPIVIEGFRLKSFEVFIRGDKIMPLTPQRFAELGAGSPIANGLDPYHRPSPVFQDKMMAPQVGYTGSQYGGFGAADSGGSTWGKDAKSALEYAFEKRAGSANPSKDRLMLASLSATVCSSDYDVYRRAMSDERSLAGFARNRTLQVAKELMGSAPTSHDDYLDFIEKTAPVHAVRIKRLGHGRWKATEINDYFYKPVARELTTAEVVARYAPLKADLAQALAGTDEILLEAAARTPAQAIVLEEHQVVAEKVEAPGHYLVVTKDGSIVEGHVWVNVRDYNGNPAHAKLFTSGNAHALQECLVGDRRGEAWPALAEGSLEVGEEGTFVGEQDGVEIALLPFRVTNVGYMGSYLTCQALGAAGEQLAFVLMPGITRYTSATGVADPLLGSHLGANVYFVPPSFKFICLGKKLRLCDDPREVKDLLQRKIFLSKGLEPFTVESTRKGHGRSLRVIDQGSGHFVLKGAILETLRRDAELSDLSLTDVHWVLTCLGVPLADGAKVTGAALARGEANVTNLRPAKDVVKKDQIHDAHLTEIAAVLRRNLSKEASTITDPKSVDAMLSLNFVNESNLVQFLENMPLFRDTEEKLAELYLYAVLGLKDQVSDQAVLAAMKALNEVNEHLEYLQSMLRMPADQAHAQVA